MNTDAGTNTSFSLLMQDMMVTITKRMGSILFRVPLHKIRWIQSSYVKKEYEVVDQQRGDTSKDKGC